jgi:hypothetical protein
MQDDTFKNFVLVGGTAVSLFLELLIWSLAACVFWITMQR